MIGTRQRCRFRCRGLRLSFMIAWIICALTSTPSFAQRDPNPVTSPIQTGPGIPKEGTDTPPNRSELGISLGSFLLYPVLDLRAGYDTNVFAQPSGQQTGSAYLAVRPSLELRSDWLNHMLNAHANGVFGWYTSASTQNYQNFDIGTDGRLDIQRDLYMTGSAAYQRATEALGSPDVAVATSPTVQNSIPVNLSLYQRFNRLYYQVSGGFGRFWYQDFSQQLSNTALPSSSRNRTEYGENLRAGYEVFEGWDFWVQGGFNQRRYDSINIVNQNRNSDGWAVTGGSTYDLGGISKLEGFVGYQSQAYQNPSLTTGAIIFGLGGVWNGYEPLTVRPFIIRSINETAFSNYINYVSTTIGAEINYTIQTAWKLNTGGSFGLADYTPAPGVASAFRHTDTFYRATLGLSYSIRPQIDIGPLYEFSAGYGPDPTTSPNYSRHIIMIRLVARR